MNSLAKAAILWIPPVAFLTTVLYRSVALYPQSKLDSAYWKLFESPTLSLWIPILLLQIYALLHWVKQLSKLKAPMFWSLLLTTLAIRCLAMLSALCSSEGYDGATLMLPIFSTSPAKPILLSVLCDGPVWDWVTLGRYQRNSFDETSRVATHVRYSVLHVFEPYKDQAACSWRDLVVRLGYVHAIDNFIHVIWLRYIYGNGPYTAHINNSELLTMMLVVHLSLYTYAERYTHVKHDCEVEAGYGKE